MKVHRRENRQHRHTNKGNTQNTYKENKKTVNYANYLLIIWVSGENNCKQKDSSIKKKFRSF